MSGMHFLTDREEERGDLLLPKSESGEGEPEVRKQVGWPAAFDTGSACSAPAVPPGFARWRGRGAAAWKDSLAADLTGLFSVSNNVRVRFYRKGREFSIQ